MGREGKPLGLTLASLLALYAYALAVCMVSINKYRLSTCAYIYCITI